MEKWDYFLDLYTALPTAGPGTNNCTRKAYGLLSDRFSAPKILDVGCGPGRQTVELLKISGGTAVALDFLPIMLERTKAAADAAGVGHRLELLQQDMTSMDFDDDTFDIIWSEGAIYNLGFENGLKKVKPFVRPGGAVAVSEVVWLKPDQPAELVEYWRQYPEIDTIEAKQNIISQLGYESVGTFTLPNNAWVTHYYDPMQTLLHQKATEWKDCPEAREVLEESQHEINMFEKYSDYFGYAFFVMIKP